MVFKWFPVWGIGYRGSIKMSKLIYKLGRKQEKGNRLCLHLLNTYLLSAYMLPCTVLDTETAQRMTWM